jgi:hypothetical protein
MSRHIAMAAAIAGTLLAGSEAQAEARVEAGVLTCTVRGGAGFIVGSTKELLPLPQAGPRRIRPRHHQQVRARHRPHPAVGHRLGGAGPDDQTAALSLSGDYGGISAEATIGLGVGANALVGGSNPGIILQPLSVQAQQASTSRPASLPCSCGQSDRRPNGSWDHTPSARKRGWPGAPSARSARAGRAAKS